MPSPDSIEGGRAAWTFPTADIHVISPGPQVRFGPASTQGFQSSPPAGPIVAREPSQFIVSPPSEPLSSPIPKTQERPSLRGQHILVVFNPAARDGRVAGEKARVEAYFRNQGANVLIVETVANRTERLTKIEAAAEQQLAQLPHGKRLFALAYGGDGTFTDMAKAAMKVRGWESRVKFIPPLRGTAGDLRAQADAPHRIKNIADFILNAVERPLEAPRITSEVGKGSIAAHSVSFGIGAILFHKRDENKAKNPKGFWNQGLWSYLRLLPYAIASPYARHGLKYNVLIERKGGFIPPKEVHAAEAMITPNRIVAGVSATPGAWGIARLQFIPPGTRGVLVLGELMARGLVTKGLGINLAGPDSQLLFGRGYQMNLLPGDEVTIEARLPNTAAWRKLIVSSASVGYAKDFTRVPLPLRSTVEPISIPAIGNGDVLQEPISHLKVKIPEAGSEIPLLAHPRSLAASISTDPLILVDRPDHTEVRTPLFNTQELYDLARKYGVSPERIPELLAIKQGVITRGHPLAPLANSQFALESLRTFPEAEKIYQRNWINNQSSFKAFWQRTVTQGGPLALGFLSYWGAEAGLEHLGIDFGGDPLLHFGAVTYLTHSVQQNITPLWTTTVNRWLKTPFDYVTARTLNLNGVPHTQFIFARHQSWTEALRGSWTSTAGSLGPGAHYNTGLKVFRAALLPVRAGLNMGLGMGLAMGAQSLTEVLLAGETKSSWSKKYVPTIAGFMGFAAPSLIHIVSPRVSQFVFQNRLARGASLVMGAAFMAELAFSSCHGLQYGALSNLETRMGFRILEQKKQAGHLNAISQGLSWLAPSLSAHLVSHESLFGAKNEDYSQLEKQDRQAGKDLMATLSTTVPALLQEMGWSWEDAFGTRRRLTDLEKRIAEDLNYWTKEDTSLNGLALMLRRNYSGHDFSQEEAKEHLANILLAGIQEQIGVAHELGLPYTQELRLTFDSDGVLSLS